MGHLEEKVWRPSSLFLGTLVKDIPTSLVETKN